ncbi:MAG TPA: polymer-forming cytoskeletal protein [Candidatus Deferrimicrobium sp.]|nr:polymer-forming cytoskeletal protein [Candidatus Deferrimicrobium sp.]
MPARTYGRRRWTILAAAIVLTLGVCQFSIATSLQQGHNIHISNLHRIDDDVYAFGQSVRVDGRIDGDLVAGAYDVTINGEITESENVFCYSLTHNGSVGNSLRGFVSNAAINGTVGRSVILFAYDTRIGSGARVERDLSVTGFSVRIDGTVGRNATIRAGRVVIAGEIDGDVRIEAGTIDIVPPAVIRGNLSYVSEKEATIDTAAGVTVMGETRWEQPDTQKAGEKEDRETDAAFRAIVLSVAKVLAGFLFGVIVVFAFRRYAEVSFEQLRSRFAVSVATGLLFFITFIAAAIILVMSVVFVIIGLALISGKTAPLGALVLVLSTLLVPISAFSTVTGALIFACGMVLVSFFIGYVLFRVFRPQPALGKGHLIVGLVVLTVLFTIPYVGLLVRVLASITGAGAIVLGIRRCRAESIAPAVNIGAARNDGGAG